jgi:copper oxidase (laccase) domain-containing protein
MPFNQWLRPEMGACGVEVMSTTRAGGVSTGKFAGFNVGVHVGDSDEAVRANRKCSITKYHR